MILVDRARAPRRAATAWQRRGAYVRHAADWHGPGRDHRATTHPGCHQAQAFGRGAVRALAPAESGVPQHRLRSDQDFTAQHGIHLDLPGGHPATVWRAPAADQNADCADVPAGLASGGGQSHVQHADFYRRHVAVDLGGNGGAGLSDRDPQGRVLPQRADRRRADQCQVVGVAAGDADLRSRLRPSRRGRGADLLRLPEERAAQGRVGLAPAPGAQVMRTLFTAARG
nr:hypothetical protein [Tanacetum cinerariifolium]